MTREDIEKQRRDEAHARQAAAENARTLGAWMMIVGGLALTAAVTAFALASMPEIPSWVRQTILTLIAILFSSGVAMHVIGRTTRRTLDQMADDRATQEERWEAVMTLLREIKRNQAFILNRPAPHVSYRVGKMRPPSDDTLELVRRQREEELQADDPEPQRDDSDGLSGLMEKAEWYNLGAAIERRRHDPDAEG